MLKKEIKRCLGPGSILIHGNNNYLSKDINSDIKEIILNNNMIEFNMDIFNDETFDMELISSATSKLPFMNKYRVILIKNIDKIEYKKLSLLLPFLNKNKKSIIILFSNIELDRNTLNKKLYKSIAANRYIWLRDFNKNDLELFIKKKLKNENYEIEEDALKFLIENIDNNLFLIENELNKLINNTNDKIITLNNIIENSYLFNSFTIFELLDSIIKKEKNKSLSIMNLYFEKSLNSDAIGFYHLLQRQFQKIVMFKYFRLKGFSFDTAKRKAKLNYYDEIKIKNNNTPFMDILKKYEQLLEFEPLVKFSGNNSFYVLENMVYRLLEE